MSPDALASQLTAAHPEWRTSAARFLPRLTAAVKRAGALDAVNAEDLLLATAALARVSPAVAEVDRRLGRVAATVAARFDPDPGFRDELHQLARVKVLLGSERTPPALARYSGEGAMARWLKVVVTSTAVDARRARRPDRERAEEEDLANVAAQQLSADEALAHGHHRAALTQALKESLEALDAEARVLLRLRFVDGHSIEEAARAIGVHRTTAMRRLERAQADLLAGVREQLKQKLRLGSKELDSLLRSIRPSLGERLSKLIRRPSLEQ